MYVSLYFTYTIRFLLILSFRSLTKEYRQKATSYIEMLRSAQHDKE